MKIKIPSLTALILLFFVACLGFIGLSGKTAYAYTCVGMPDDFYFETPGSLGENKTKIPAGQTPQSVNFHWDESLGHCVVTVTDADNAYKSQNDDGSPRACTSGNDRQVKIDGVWNCAPLVTRTTNDIPVNDDGTPISASQRFCGGVQDNYDAESFSCKESGSCNLTLSCDYNQVGLNPDPTKAKVDECTGAGATFDTAKHECNWTKDTCDAKNGGQGYWDASKNQCNAYSDYANATDCAKVQGEWLDKGKNADGTEHFECVKPGTPGSPGSSNDTKKAGDQGEQDTFTNCGKAETNLISCDANADCNSAGTHTADVNATSKATTGSPVVTCILRFGVQALTALVGIAAVGGIVWESLQYARAGDNESILSGAKDRIRDIVIGLVVYGFMVAIIGWLIPGSVFG
jgi:hypothetical protein